MKYAGLRLALAVAALSMAPTLGCTRAESAPMNGQSHWLAPCTTDADCAGGLRCECGLCNSTCTGDGECGALSSGAVCRPAELLSPQGCGTSSSGAALCALLCSTNDDCTGAIGTTCREGRCASSGQPADSDAATGVAGRAPTTSGQDAGSPPPDASMCPVIDLEPEQPAPTCPEGTAEVWLGDPEYMGLSQEVELFEGFLSAGEVRFGANGTLERMRVREVPEEYFGHFVRIRGKAQGFHESVFLWPETIECITPQCTTDDSGQLQLDISLPQRLTLDLGNEAAVCSGIESAPGLAIGLHWDTAAAIVDINIVGTLEAQQDVRANVHVSLHDLYLDGGGRGEFHSSWSGDCPAVITGLTPVDGTNPPTVRIDGVVAPCTLEPNGRGVAACAAELHELRFSNHYYPGME